MAGITEDIGNEKGEDLPRGPGPTHHLAVAHRALAEAAADQFVEGHELHRAEQQSQRDHDQQPGGQPQRGSRCPQPSPQLQQAPGGVEAGHQQRVVGDLDVTGQRLHAQHPRASHHVGHWRVANVALFLLLAHDHLNAGQQQRQPGSRRDNHAEDHADDQKAAEHVDHARQQGGGAAHAQHAGEDVHADARQPDLQPGEEAVGAAQGQNVEEQAEGIEGGMLTSGQKGHTSEEIGVPQGKLAGLDRLPDEPLPDVVLQDEITQQLVVGSAHPLGGRKTGPGRKGE